MWVVDKSRDLFKNDWNLQIVCAQQQVGFITKSNSNPQAVPTQVGEPARAEVKLLVVPDREGGAPFLLYHLRRLQLLGWPQDDDEKDECLFQQPHVMVLLRQMCRSVAFNCNALLASSTTIIQIPAGMLVRFLCGSVSSKAYYIYIHRLLAL